VDGVSVSVGEGVCVLWDGMGASAIGVDVCVGGGLGALVGEGVGHGTRSSMGERICVGDRVSVSVREGDGV